jgi:hypothetical protein
VNLQHFWTFVWLRWRLLINQMRRGGIANFVVLAVLAVLAGLLAVGLFITGFAVGLWALPGAPPVALLLVWDGLVAGFLFFWLVGLMAELQRSEVLSLDKFLHLPVTLTGVFLINYVSSLVGLSTIIFGSASLGLCIGLALSRGPGMLWLFPLVAAFILMVTALTYQFQGWLASLMANPRRRRTIVVVLTIVFITIFQLPNLVNLWLVPRMTDHAKVDKMFARTMELNGQLQRGEITVGEFNRRIQESKRADQAEDAQRDREMLDSVGQTAWIISAALPPGWLPIGAMAASEGGVLTPLLGIAGMTLIGSVSLWRAYRTTIRYYTGQFTATPARQAPATPVAPVDDGRPRLLEQSLPRLSEQTSAIALACFQSLLRAPEAKMLLLTPIIMVVVFGSMLVTRGSAIAGATGSLVPFGAMAMTLFSMVQLVGNQFGFDRSGFRIFVLSPAPRRDILLGKNLAVAPWAFGIGWAMILLVQILRPMPVDQFLAQVPQTISMFLIFCLMANWLSILAPMPVAAGSLKPVNPSFVTILFQFVFMLALPIALSPVLLPLLVEALLPADGWTAHVPVGLLVAIAECAIIVVIYWVVLTSQGELLQRREKAILEVVTRKAE